MGGGVIIKPLLDILGHYDVDTIGMLSCITVFAMAVVSILKQLRQKIKISAKIALPLSAGAVLGGNLGQRILASIIASLGDNRVVVVVQNIALGLLIGVVFLYMLYKSKIKTLHVDGVIPSLLVGLFLGFVSSFLGIGGGPINVALLIFLFSFDTKTATVYSIVTILFAQISKLVSVTFTTGFGRYDFSILPAMVAGAILGGFIGSWLNKKLPEKTVDLCFNGVQVLVFCICILNIVRNVI